MLTRRILVLLLLAGLTADLLAQEYHETVAARLQGGVLYALYDADFSSSGDIIDCGLLGSGSGFNGTINAILELPVSRTLGIGIGLGWAGRSGAFSSTNTYPIRDTVSGELGTLAAEYVLDATLTYLEIQPDLRWAVLGTPHQRTLGLIVGPRIALPLSATFVQRETVQSPEGATFVVNGSRTQERIIASAPLTTKFDP